nr:ATP-dependent RNA helicase DEAH11, chloroplastic-like [Tanacetum cinerariifolium]
MVIKEQLHPLLETLQLRTEISFDGSLHLEAAKALEHINGKALQGCQPWQKIKCQQQFHSSVSCPASVYMVIQEQLHPLLKTLQLRTGAEFYFGRNENGSYRVKVSAKATKIMAESRRPLEQLMNGRTINDARLTPSVLQVIFSRDGFSLQKSIQCETGTFFLFDRHNHSFRVFGPLNKLDFAQQRLVQALVTLHDTKQLDVCLRGPSLPPDIIKKVVEKFGPDLHGLKERFPGSFFSLNTRYHTISIRGSKEVKQNVEEIVQEVGAAASFTGNPAASDRYFVTKLTLLGKMDELFRASLGSFVETSCGKYRFCPSPDCPSVYQVAQGEDPGRPFACGACSVETCTRCHLENHPFLSCEMYKEFKRDPDMSLKEWMKDKDVKHCPVCRFTIEKIDGCNHIEC